MKLRGNVYIYTAQISTANGATHEVVIATGWLNTLQPRVSGRSLHGSLESKQQHD